MISRRSFGGRVPAYDDSDHYFANRFHNRLPSEMIDTEERSSLMLDFARRPRVPRPRVSLAQPELPEQASDLAATWLGHTTVLLEVGGHWVITDPVFSERVSPSSVVGPRRLHPTPMGIDELPQLDAVLISHDHYDHLDVASIEALAPTGVAFVVPLGIGAHLAAWGVPSEQIVELDWDQSHAIGDLRLTCTEARHFSGRLFARNLTLWSSWVITAGQRRVFFGGDTGYTEAFKEIGDRFDGFDLTVLPVGAYDRRWADIHLDPAEAVQVHLDVRGELMLPVHWATFNLAFHAWDAPIEWTQREAGERGARVATPRPGQRFEATDPPAQAWWRQD